ncbi:MAG: hypothetical protein JOZ52_04460 [Acidobacteria bacterium]|nr:hypothetical protein [Acidobacteriota bacterium]
MAEQIVLPFKLIRRSGNVKAKLANDDLVGLTYFDGLSDVVITGVCPSNPKHVRVERERDGKSWTVPAGLIRLIVKRKRRRRIA